LLSIIEFGVCHPIVFKYQCRW